MDFDDLFSEPAAAPVRAGRKFQPKGKPLARKVFAATADQPPAVAKATDQQEAAPVLDDSISIPTNQATDPKDKVLVAPLSSQVVASVEVSGAQETSVSNEATDLDSAPSFVQEADISPGLAPTDVSDQATTNAGDNENDLSEGGYIFPSIPLDASVIKPCNAEVASPLLETTSSKEERECFEDAVSGGEDVLVEIVGLDSEGVGAISFPGLQEDSTCEAFDNSEERAVKFHPKPKHDNSMVNFEAQYRLEDKHVLDKPGVPDIVPETHTMRFDDDYLMNRTDNCLLIPETSADCLLNQVTEQTFLVSQQNDNDTFPDKVNLLSASSVADLEGWGNVTSENYQEERLASTSNEGIETSNYSYRLRRCKVAEKAVDVEHTVPSETEESLREVPNGDADENGNYEGSHGEEDKSRSKRPRRRSKKSATENVEPSRKRKKKGEVSDQSSMQPPKKKFPHSTRRRRRTVDKSFLEMSDDEIDFQSVPIRDLLIRADIKQRLASKPLTTGNTSASNESFNQDKDANTNPSSSNVIENNGYYNYHSFMNRTPTMRWSKLDTELFYEAVSQFGSDLTMIQQLFPGRTRHQIKLKYKKEERQHPMRLFDALSNQVKDHSYYEQVIEKLKEQVAEEEMSEGTQQDGSVGVAGDEEDEESYPVTHEEASMDGTAKKEESLATGEEADDSYLDSHADYDDIDEEAMRAYKAAFG